MIVQNKYRSYTNSQDGFLGKMNFAFYLILIV